MIGNEFTGPLDALTDVMQITRVHNNWVAGVSGQYQLELKVFANPSMFGINEGRVSKLRIARGDEDVAGYDRGWGLTPTSADVSMLVNFIVRALDGAAE